MATTPNSALGSPSRQRIAVALHQSPDGLTAAELADRLHLHVTTVRFHLEQLHGTGLVDHHDSVSSGAGRPSKIYQLTRPIDQRVDRETALDLLTELLSDALAESLSGSAVDPADIGRQWAERNVAAVDRPRARTPGQWVSKMGSTLDTLSSWGYTPELSTSEAGRTVIIHLRDCPFLETARKNPAVVCAAHEGLIRGCLSQLGETDTKVVLQPFVTATTCQAHVTTGNPFDDQWSDSAPRHNEPMQSPDPFITQRSSK